MFRKSLLKMLLQKVIILFIQNRIRVLLNGRLLLIGFVIKKDIRWLLFSVVVACLYSPMIQEKSAHPRSVLMQRVVVQHNPIVITTLGRYLVVQQLSMSPVRRSAW